MELLWAALLLVLASFGSLVVADFVFTLMPFYSDYVVARVGIEYVSFEVSKLPSDKRGERKRRKLMPKLEEARRRLSRYSLARLFIILPLYVATAFASVSAPILLPVPCCIPVLSHVFKEACFTTAPILVALTYIAFLPLVQESLFTMLMLKRGWVEGIARRLERW